MIAGLCHHGSGPRYTNLLDPQWPHLLAQYAGHVAERYPHIAFYTPVNEPLTTARFAALYGTWYPHHSSYESFLRALVNECKGTVLAMRAIRRVRPDAELIQTEDLGKTFGTPLTLSAEPIICWLCAATKTKVQLLVLCRPLSAPPKRLRPGWEPLRSLLPIGAGAMARRPVSNLETYTLPAEPLEDGWGDRWDDDALEYRFERFGFKLKNSNTGYSVINMRTGDSVSLPQIGFEAVNRTRQEICELIEDLEMAEELLRKQLLE